jgi:hypothetical protein
MKNVEQLNFYVLFDNKLLILVCIPQYLPQLKNEAFLSSFQIQCIVLALVQCIAINFARNLILKNAVHKSPTSPNTVFHQLQD